MIKKLLTLAFGLLLAFGANAQGGNPTVPQDSIRFWTGTGTNRAVIAITWEDDNEDMIGIAWGVQWNGTVTIGSIMDTIAAYDSRMTVTGSSTWINNMAYNDANLGLNLVGIDGWWWYGWKDANDNDKQSGGVSADILANGDFVDWMQMGAADIMLYAEDPNATEETPEEATIAASDIIYWVGEGSSEAILAVNWADTALAWGYRFNGTKTVANMMDDIAAADPRFSYTAGGGMLSDINFVAGDRTLAITPGNYWGSSNNGIMDMGLGQSLNDVDLEKWADPAAGIAIDSTYDEQWSYWWYTYVYPMTIHPVSEPLPVEATIAASAIEYWVGEGSNEAILAVNWADTALAWGYRFNGTKTVTDMMDDIAAADPRFSYELGSYGLDDILFVKAPGDTLRKQLYSYWESKNNGTIDAGMSQNLNNGDFEKWAEPAAGVVVDSTFWADYNYWSYTYVYPMTIHSVGQPAGMGPFCDKVGTEGCTAVKFDDSRIKAWATACTIVRGSQNLSNPSAPVVTYGDESQAVGAATANTMDVVSLGDGGTATLTFATPIVNGDGYDFAVFENSFDDYFLELAFVEVSSDGQHFVRFPATSLTQTARQIASHVEPSYINNLAGKYKVGYGTPFDLDELRDSTGIDLNNITHVRIVDVVGSIDPQYATYDAFGHIVNDPFPTISYSAGFDLDGVAVMNQKGNGIEETEETFVSVYPNPVANMMNITASEEMTALLFDMSGRCIMTIQLHNGNNSISMDGISNGVYLLRTAAGVQKVVKK